MNRSSPCPLPLLASVSLFAAALPCGAWAEESSRETPERPLVITGYGEINLDRPLSRAADTTIDLRRFVFGFHYRFNERLKFFSEVELEHAVSSAEDRGEVEIEQAAVEYQLTPVWAARGGLILMPVGLLNESHEPTAYYGVERNFVETAIIPSTWREGALAVVANFDNGINFEAGASTTFDVSKWDPASSEGRDSPLGSIHQELQLARAHDIAAFAALNWRGIPGLLAGGSAFASRINQGQPGTPRSTLVLWDVHARWTPWRLDLSALYTRGTISNSAAINTPFVGSETLVPASFFGWYLQAAIRAWSHGDLALSPFVRYEEVNPASSYADLGQGLTPAALATEKVFTGGANFYVTSGFVVKADVQVFRNGTDRNRLDFGLGWSF